MKKLAFEARYGRLEGIEDVGVSEYGLRVYVRSPEVRERIPQNFEGVRIEVVVTGSISGG